jgi:hypothetical protein
LTKRGKKKVKKYKKVKKRKRKITVSNVDEIIQEELALEDQ